MPSFLVIGYGNPTHGDDVMGQQVISQIQQLGLKNVGVCAVEQLTPELSAQLATVNYAIFVDACQMEQSDVRISPLEACGSETTGSSVPGLGHSLHPCSLLALTHSVYKHHPQAWWVEVAAEDFRVGHPLSAQAQQNIQNAVEQIATLIQELN
jgi:hydrogenase maturation protease